MLWVGRKGERGERQDGMDLTNRFSVKTSKSLTSTHVRRGEKTESLELSYDETN